MISQSEAGPPAFSEHEGFTIHRKPNGDIEVAKQGLDFIKARIPKRGDFDENLADIAPSGLAEKLVEYYLTDQESREDFFEREKRSLEMLGIHDTIPAADDKAPGMNKVVHPMLMEATVRFQANAIAELFPATGPAKPEILGTVTAAKQAKADRIEKFLNFYLTEIDRGYFADTDQMLFYLPMSGSAFRKGGQNCMTGMPELRYVKATSFIAPYAGTDLANMPRYCHEYTMTGDDLRRSMDVGMFEQQKLTLLGNNSAEHNRTSDMADGRINEMHQDDQLYTILEYHIDLEIPDDQLAGHEKGRENKLRPYIVIIDKDDKNVFMVRRNWKKGDKKYKKRIRFAHHKYLPGLGFYGFGLPHVIGSLGNAASGVVNAVLDAAQMATFQGGFKTKEGKSLGGEVRLEAATWKDVDSSYEDLAKSFYTPPFKEPGPVMFQLLNALTDAGQRFAGTADVAVGDANNNAPVGTTVALIEQSQKPQSAIHKRLHKSFSDELKMFTELVEDFMPNDYIYKIGSDTQHLLKSDFDGEVDVASVTDPNIYSDTQRIQIAQATQQIVQQNPDLFTPKKKAAVVLRLMQALKVPDIEEIEPEAEIPKYLDAVTENGLILQGKGVRTFPAQDDEAHIKIHQHGAATAAAAQMDPQTQQMILASYGVHIRDHMAQLYAKQIYAAAGIPPPPMNPDGDPIELDPQTEMMVTRAVLAKLPPPPPPPAPPAAAPSPEQVAQQKLQANDQLSQQKIKQQAIDHAASTERDTQAFLTDEARKEQAHKAQLRRIKELTAAEERRKDATTAADIVRTGAKAKLDVGAKVLAHHADHHHTAVQHHITLRAQAEEAKQRIAARREEAAQARKDAAAARSAELEHKKGQMKAEGSHSQEILRQKRVAGKVGLQQKREAVKIARSKPKAKPKGK